MESNNEGGRLAGRRIAILMTDGVEQVEYTEPRAFLEGHGATVTVVSPKESGDEIQGFHHHDRGDRFRVDIQVRQANVDDYDALVLPGGVANPDQLRLSPESIAFIKAFSDKQKLIAAICHGAWPLIDAGVAQSRHMTSWPSLRCDLINAGAEWTDDEVVIDASLITSRNPDDIPAFNQAILDSLMVDAQAADTGPSS